MAAASAPRPSGLIDPLKGMKYPIQLGESITKDAAQDRFYSVKFNHKPKHASPNQKTTITTSNQKYKLVLSDEGPSSPSGVTYKYEGTLDPHTSTDLSTPNHSYGLVFSPEKNAFILEKISADLHFNLVSNPGTATKSQLALQYPQLELQKDQEVEDEDELFQDGASYKSESDASMAEEDNPYDYRHFMSDGKFAQAKERTVMSRSQSPNLGGSSPYLGGKSPHVTGYPYLSANSPALKPKPKAKPSPFISKSTPRPTSSIVSTKTKAAPSSTKPRIKTPPRIVEEGLYSPHSSSDSDSESDSDRPQKSKSKSKGKQSSSDLIIDLGSPPEKKRQTLHRPKNAQKPGVPVSFREATSASEDEGDADESGLDIDMGGDVDAEGDIDADYEMDDEDVEILKLPSPARVQDNPQTNSGDAVGLGLGGDMMEEEDDLAAALTMELEKDMAEGPTLQQDEESEVSEEE